MCIRTIKGQQLYFIGKRLVAAFWRHDATWHIVWHELSDYEKREVAAVLFFYDLDQDSPNVYACKQLELEKIVREFK